MTHLEKIKNCLMVRFLCHIFIFAMVVPRLPPPHDDASIALRAIAPLLAAARHDGRHAFSSDMSSPYLVLLFEAWLCITILSYDEVNSNAKHASPRNPACRRFHCRSSSGCQYRRSHRNGNLVLYPQPATSDLRIKPQNPELDPLYPRF
jgi:hypothetical protein